MSNTNEEIDLMFIYNKIKETYNGLLLSFYRWIQFLLKNWIIVLLVIGAGILLGYFMEKNSVKSKETIVLVQINFGGVNYVYNAVEQLRKKINEGDKTSLAELADYYDDIFVIQNIQIEPVPDILDIINITDPNNGNIKTFLDQSKFEEDLLMSEMFVSQYKTHRLTITTTENGNANSINAVLKYLNNNNGFAEVQKIAIENSGFEIAETVESISSIDSILNANGTLNRGNNASQLYFNTASNVNLHFLVQEKSSLMKELQQLKTDQMRYQDGTVTLLNKPMLHWKTSLLDKKMIILPIIFFVLFSLTVFIFNFFKRMKVKHEEDLQSRL